jgi:hypothetical protein
MRRVFVLDGGLPAWRREGGAVESSAPAHPLPCADGSWDDHTDIDPSFWRTKNDILANLVSPTFTLVDARSDGRFSGKSCATCQRRGAVFGFHAVWTLFDLSRRGFARQRECCGTGRDPEPRAGLRQGHIPNSLNLPWATVVQPTGTLHAAERIAELLDDVSYTLPLEAHTSYQLVGTRTVLRLARARVQGKQSGLPATDSVRRKTLYSLYAPKPGRAERCQSLFQQPSRSDRLYGSCCALSVGCLRFDYCAFVLCG